MFERFTDRARRVVVLAQEEARALNHNYIGTEHILLGLIHEGDGVAAQALASLGISFDGVRGEIEEIIGHGGSAPAGHIPFTPRAKKVLELALREALQMGHNYIGTEHILLGVIREGEGVAAQVLVRKGADLSQVRQRVIQILSGYSPLSEKSLATSDVVEMGGATAVSGEMVSRDREHRMFLELLRAGELLRDATLDVLISSWDDDADSFSERMTELVRLAELAGDSNFLERLQRFIELDEATGEVTFKHRRD